MYTLSNLLKTALFLAINPLVDTIYSMQTYNKLVRDKIPERIEAKGEACRVHVASESEFWEKLKEKFSEEVQEFRKDESMGELADILDVIDAICEHKGWSKEEVLEIQQFKKFERGGFSKRIILEEA